MRTTKNTWQSVLYILILLAAVCLLFWWYSVTNSQRIERQNLNYAMDSARQTAQRIDGELTNALRRVRNYAYVFSASPDGPDITSEMLRDMEDNSDFDALRFVNAQGINLTSDGTTTSIQDREYFAHGMSGEDGCALILQSRITGKATMVFYAPLWHEGKTCGLLMGLYLAEDYLREMLKTSYFGADADVFLCTQEGQIVASSGGSYDQSLLAALLENGVIDSQTADGAWKVFRGEDDEAGFVCADSSQTDNLCMLRIPNSDYVLVQTFTRSVTQSMVREANHAGMVLQAILIFLDRKGVV